MHVEPGGEAGEGVFGFVGVSAEECGRHGRAWR